MAITPSQTQSISNQIKAIQSGLNSLSAAKSAGLSITPQTTVQQAQAYTSGGSKSSGGSGETRYNADGSSYKHNFVSSNPADAPGFRPSAQPATQLAQAETPVQEAPVGSQYQVKPGDTLSGIAKAQGVNISDITGFKSGDPNKIFPGEQLSIGQQYKKAADLARQTGVAPGQDAGMGSAGVGAFMNATQGQQEEPPSLLGEIMGVDSNFDSIFTMFDEFMSPASQKKSLLEEYQQMESSLGINAMNQELIDAKRIIEGTESDIRNEITAAGGFGTDSQVLALANARNKSLIKNYNYLLESRDNARTQLSTYMDLSIKDREAAENEFDRKLNFAFKVQEFQERAKANATTQFKYLIDNGFGAALLTNPYETRLAEKTLGIPAGGLKTIVAQQQADRAMEMAKKNLELDVLRSGLSTDVLQRRKLQAEIGEINKATPGTPEYQAVQDSFKRLTGVNPDTGKPDPRSQFAGVMNLTGAKTDDKLKLTGAVIGAAQAFAAGNQSGKIGGLGFGQIVPSRYLNQQGQDNRTNLSALEGTVESWMTGASVAEDQQKRIKRDMVPKRGDPDSVIRRKVNALTNYMMNYAAGSLSTQGVDWSPQPVDFWAPVVAVDPTGDEWVAQ